VGRYILETHDVPSQPSYFRVHFPVCEKYGPSSLNGMHFAYFILHQFL